MVSQRVEIPSLDNPGTGKTSIVKDTKTELRGAPATTIEWMILAYVAGLIWTEVKQLWDEGVQEYAHDMWNILDFVTNSLYIATLTLRVIAYLQVKKEREEKKWTADLQRKDWDPYDPNLIAEALFAAANIFSSLKLVYIFTVNPHLGPLQISLGRMIMDIMKFGMVYFLVLFSFACGLNHLYWYYATLRSEECKAGMDESCDRKYKSFANLFEIVQSLYWSIYGLVDLEHAELREPHEFTQFIGKLMFGSYSWIAFVVLLNLLIAMMSNSYQNISSQADEEWKFARSKLWISYFDDSGTLPPPFNIIPSPKTFYYIILWFKNKLCACSKHQKRNRWQSIRKIVKKINEKEIRYQAVMRDLIKRYIMAKQRSPQRGDGVTEDDINELKQDISSFRYELLEILRNNGMKTPNPNQPKPSNRRMSRRKNQRRSLERLKKSFTVGNFSEMSGNPETGTKQDVPGRPIPVTANINGSNVIPETILEESVETSFSPKREGLDMPISNLDNMFLTSHSAQSSPVSKQSPFLQRPPLYNSLVDLPIGNDSNRLQLCQPPRPSFQIGSHSQSNIDKLFEPLNGSDMAAKRMYNHSGPDPDSPKFEGIKSPFNSVTTQGNSKVMPSSVAVQNAVGFLLENKNKKSSESQVTKRVKFK